MPTPHSQPGIPVDPHAASDEDLHHGGDQSPLNDADSDEDRDPEGELDLTDLDLDSFADTDKLDIGSANLS